MKSKDFSKNIQVDEEQKDITKLEIDLYSTEKDKSSKQNNKPFNISIKSYLKKNNWTTSKDSHLSINSESWALYITKQKKTLT